jgi:DEAD/DEAH box helicase domain-containing protein
MIPSVVAWQARQTALDYIDTTLGLDDAAVARALHAHLDGPDGLFKGPAVHVRLPFRVAPDPKAHRLHIAPPFPPYAHQLQAWTQLASTAPEGPQNTLVTTGTGSGKTECFLFPLLDHCWRHRSTPGVKAIVLYPMNALATDQARRIAQLIHDHDELRGKVSAGVYIGGQGQHKKPTAEALVDDRDVLRRDPPDILLTNYRMLDFLLMRPEDKPLWRHNAKGLLQYLVLDELHTYDGAQGSDVACLIRRLRERLGVPGGDLCCVGTSATIAGAEGSGPQKLADFAETLFGAPFSLDHIVREDRLQAEEFLPAEVTETRIPSPRDKSVADKLDADAEDDAETWLFNQSRLWFGKATTDEVALGTALAGHAFLRTLLGATGGALIDESMLVEQLAQREPQLGVLPADQRSLVLRSFLGLVSHAKRRPDPSSDRTVPFLQVQVQLWVRELRHLLRRVPAYVDRRDTLDEPRFVWREFLTKEQDSADGRHWGPMAHCRECGATGFAAMQRLDEDKLNLGKSVGQAWLESSEACRFVVPMAKVDRATPVGSGAWRWCPLCLHLTEEQQCDCMDDGPRTVPVIVEQRTRGKTKQRFRAQCPVCDADDALRMVGARAASLSSVLVSHLFHAQYNTDRKLVAFTDSVQDASHRAGFFEARTYRFNLRTAIAQALHAAGGQTTLAELPREFETWWRQDLGRAGAERLDARYAAAFLPADLRELPDYRALMEEPEGQSRGLMRDLRSRLSWEITRELGLASQLGRSLEKTGVVTVAVDAEALERAAARLETGISEERMDWLRRVQRADARHFLRGLLHRLRCRGGVWHHFLDQYARFGGNRYLLSKYKNPLMSPMGRRTRAPKFLTDTGKHLDAPMGNTGTRTWFGDWLARTLPLKPDRSAQRMLYQMALDILVDEGILEVRTGERSRAWGLRPDALQVTSALAGLACDTCARPWLVPEDHAPAVRGMACPQFRCAGSLVPAPRQPSYYTRVYERGELKRIIAGEHTGLLQRPEREALEERFKAKKSPRPDAENLLVCTPTLEMGIDIGDLSAVMLCSVPPTPANYLQRIGRAGRSTGNALCIAMANARPHDLYFHARPSEMMQGEVTPPGAWLGAPEMLRRQLVAYAMDRWCQQETELKRLPQRAHQGLGKTGEQGFPGRFLRWHDDHRDSVVAGFLAMFSDVVPTDVAAELEEFGLGPKIRAWVEEAFALFSATQDDYRRQLKEVGKKRQDVLDNPGSYEDTGLELQELQRMEAALQRALRELRNKYILNVLTDESVLPNYAFPEPGVKLQSLLKEPADAIQQPAPKGRGRGGRKKSSYRRYEYIRPAATALKELAPFNSFYAEGHKVQVQEVHLGNRGDLVETWRVCEHCHHQTKDLGEVTEPGASCPRCMAPGWDGLGRLRQMVPFKIARTIGDLVRSATTDSADERESRQYSVGDIVEVRPIHLRGRAWASEALCFGFESLHNLTLRQVNFGIDGTPGPSTKVAGTQAPERGFEVCRDCQRVRDPFAPSDREFPHAPHCKVKRGAFKADIVNLWLYRQVKSEAIRFLLPVLDADVTRRTANFKAALELGFRQLFEGRPMHLRFREMDEPVDRDDKLRRRFLVVFDMVPGGTGYLAELGTKDRLREVLERARAHMAACSCEDGCYRCLFAYQNSRDLETLSKRFATDMLNELLEGWEELSESHQTLSKVPIASRHESDLEIRFSNALEDWGRKTEGARVHRGQRQGETQWTLSLGGNTWRMRLQVEASSWLGLGVPTRPDFVLECTHGATDALPVAVYLDGFAYHVKPKESEGRLPDDFRKRSDLLNSGKVRVWSLTWWDVKHFAEGTGDQAPALLSPGRGLLGKLGAVHGLESVVQDARLSGVHGLLAYLEDPRPERWEGLAGALVGASLLEAFGAQSREGQFLDPDETSAYELALQHDGDLSLLAVPSLGATVPERASLILRKSHLHLVVRGKIKDVLKRQPSTATVTLRLDDMHANRQAVDFRDAWWATLAAWNWLQFHPGVRVATSEAIATGDVASWPAAEEPLLMAADRAPEGGWDLGGPPPEPESPELSMYLSYHDGDPDLQRVIRELHRRGLPLPDDDSELALRGRGRSLTTLLHWEDRKVAVVDDPAQGGQPQERAIAAAEGEGWTVVRWPTPDAAIVEAVEGRYAAGGGE